MSATSAVSVWLATTAREDPYGLILARWYDSLLVGGCALLALAAALLLHYLAEKPFLILKDRL